MTFHFGIILLTVGLLGIAFSTVLPPLLATVFWKKKSYKSDSNNIDLLIQIPAKAGSLTQLKETLGALLPAIHSSPSRLQIRVQVFIDGTDEKIASFLSTIDEVNYYIQDTAVGKWSSIKKLCSDGLNTKADWVATLDVGTIVPQDIFTITLKHLNNTGIDAIYPAYQIESGASRLQELYWYLESCLKYIENKAGGPVSAHGALMFFRSEALKSAISYLPEENFTNDDVILPLIIRLLNPDIKSHYLKSVIVLDSDVSGVNDCGVKLVNSLKRRKRLAKGNLQWIKLLNNSELIFSNPSALILSLRRIFRLFWGYWLVAILLGLGLCISSYITLTFIFLLIASALKERTSGLYEAFICSLASPFWILDPQSGVDWR